MAVRAIDCSLLLAALALAACSAEDAPAPSADGEPGPTAESRGDARPTACDPLAAGTEPALLGNVIAVGRAVDGTLYVASRLDPAGNVDRVFVLEDGALQRKRVLGSGGAGGFAADSDHAASFEDEGAQSSLVIKLRGNAVVGIALAHDGGKAYFDALPSDATQLEIVAPSEIQGLPLRNIPGMVTVEFVANAPDGSQLVLTRPTVDWTYEDFRLYYGRDGKLTERVITNASRGTKTYITFVVDSQDYDVVLTTGAFSADSSSTLRGKDGSTQELTVAWDMPSLPAAAGFECLR